MIRRLTSKKKKRRTKVHARTHTPTTTATKINFISPVSPGDGVQIQDYPLDSSEANVQR